MTTLYDCLQGFLSIFSSNTSETSSAQSHKQLPLGKGHVYSPLPQSDQSLKDRAANIDKNPKARLTGLFLSQIKDKESIGESAYLIPSSQQTHDGTGYGGQNCGYHALKNTLIAVCGDHLSGNAALSFKDPKLFQTFYRTYCAPLLTRMDAKKRDATYIIVREILNKFIQDSAPPKELVELQKHVAAQRENIIIVNGANHHETGQAMLGVIDKENANGLLRLHRFITKKSEGSLGIVFGNSTLGHWYSVTLVSDKEGKIQAYFTDSMGGKNPSLNKTRELLEAQIKNPANLLNIAYATYQDIVSARAGAIASDKKKKGEVSSTIKQTILESEKTLSGAIEGAKIALTGNWAGSINYKNQTRLDELITLLQFYQENLADSHPKKATVSHLLAQITKEKDNDYAVKLFDQAIKDFEASSIPVVSKSRIVSLFKQGKLIMQQRKKIKGLDLSKQANLNAIEKMSQEANLGNMGIEDNTDMIEKANYMLMTYEEAKKRDQVNEFIKHVQQGAACFTGRMKSTIEFYTQIQRIPPDLNLSEKYTQIKTMLADTVEEFVDSRLLLENPTFSDLDLEEKDHLRLKYATEKKDTLAKDFIAKYKQDIIDCFEEVFPKIEKGKKFEDYEDYEATTLLALAELRVLKKKEYKQGDTIEPLNWKEIINKLDQKRLLEKLMELPIGEFKRLAAE